eukprot:TRINITY_DN4395_c0_g1_i1.p1 TRINITY_DN4395_c0_g1~~TRINITY_DN4395_c0_g1_i1.p1  ORF type:complete len:146 (-),score=58.04 TRINITY_DN4395_c0_g1_i1:92-529(-)
MSASLFEDIFEVQDADKGGRKFDKVSRLECVSEVHGMQLTLDINYDVYPIQKGERFTLVLMSSLNPDGGAEERYYDPEMQSSIVDKYDYVTYGKVYKYIEEKGGSVPRVSVYVSYGGLLMQLTGDYRNLQAIEVEARIYCLIRKI